MCQTIILKESKNKITINVTLSISNVCSLSHYTDFFPIISLFITHGCTRCMHDETDTAQWSGFFSIQMVACFFPLYSNTRESHSEVSRTGCGLVCFLCLFTAQTSGRLFKRDAVKATETP